MEATKSEDDGEKLIPLTEEESVSLIQKGLPLNCAFGIGGMALKWDTTKPMNKTVRELLLMRGVLNENMDGAGI